MSDLTMTCRVCTSRTTAVGEAFRDGDPCPHCGAGGNVVDLEAATLTRFLLALTPEERAKLTAMHEDREDVIRWLRDRADRLAADHTPGGPRGLAVSDQ